jgi:hypothetical protein
MPQMPLPLQTSDWPLQTRPRNLAPLDADRAFGDLSGANQAQ